MLHRCKKVVLSLVSHEDRQGLHPSPPHCRTRSVEAHQTGLQRLRRVVCAKRDGALCAELHEHLPRRRRALQHLRRNWWHVGSRSRGRLRLVALQPGVHRAVNRAFKLPHRLVAPRTRCPSATTRRRLRYRGINGRTRRHCSGTTGSSSSHERRGSCIGRRHGGSRSCGSGSVGRRGQTSNRRKVAHHHGWGRCRDSRRVRLASIACLPKRGGDGGRSRHAAGGLCQSDRGGSGGGRSGGTPRRVRAAGASHLGAEWNATKRGG